MNDMKDIKDILNGYEVPYDHNDWIKLEKDLPKSPGMSGLTKTILVATALILSVSGIYFLTRINKTTEKETTVIAKSDNNKPVVSEQNINCNDIKPDNNNVIVATDEKNLNSEDKEFAENNKNVVVNEINPEIKENNTAIKEPEVTDNHENTNKNNVKETAVETVATPDLSKLTFKIEVLENCIPAKVIFTAENLPEKCDIIWNTDENSRVYGAKAEHTYIEAGNYQPEVSVIFNNFILKTEKLRKITINQSSFVKINFDNSENLYYFTCSNVEDLKLLWSIDNQQFSEKEVSYNFNRAGEYLIGLTAINEFGCKSEATEKVNIVVEHVYYVPNAFMPNANGINSSFGPIGENLDFVSYKLVIVDGNGNPVFDSDKPEFMWNGRINNIGEEVRPGFYLWEIKTLDKFGNIQTKKGRVNLIRN